MVPLLWQHRRCILRSFHLAPFVLPTRLPSQHDQIAVVQALDYLLQKDPDTLMQSGAVRMLQQKLDQVQDDLTGVHHRLFSFRQVHRTEANVSDTTDGS
jgi:hypothetical protein